MSNSTVLPAKDQVIIELRQLATTLSNDMQSAALSKARELGFDLNKGRLTLEETLLNLNSSRDTLLEAVERQKLAQLPLKIQYTLWTQVQKISEALTALVNGTDTVLTLEEVVDDLLASIWQYNLHNLSEQVLGFQEKMNQLKDQEKAILHAHRVAKEFHETETRVQRLLGNLNEVEEAAEKARERTEKSADEINTIVARAQEQEQRVSAVAAQVEQENSAAVAHAASARSSAADAQAIAERLPDIHSELTELRTEQKELLAETTRLSSEFEDASAKALEKFQERFDEIKSTLQATSEDLHESVNNSSTELRAEVKTLIQDTSIQLDTAQSDHAKQLKEHIFKGQEESAALITTLQLDYKRILGEESDKFKEHRELTEKEHERLISQLDELEAKIKESIRRATGFSLFHSFQKRQDDLAKSKRFWGIALASVVATSLILSIAFMVYVSQLTEFKAAFYLKLSVSLPLIYAIWFCSVQYSRERRLEEEYAFKSSISISLDPYRELVEKLVGKDNPEELAKYTAFVIESVGRVFTSPTDHAFSADGKDSSPVEGVIGSIKDLVTEVLKTKVR